MNTSSLASLLLLFQIGLTGSIALTAGSPPIVETDRSRDGLLGLVQQVVTTSPDGMTTSTYDRTGRLLESVTRTSPPAGEPEIGDQVQRFVYQYDDSGNRIREMTEDREGQAYLSRLYAYNATGQRAAEALYHMCGTFSSLRMYTYNPTGSLRDELIFHLRSLVRYLFDYDASGRLLTRTMFKNGAPYSVTIYTYDEHDRLLEVQDHLADGTFVSMTQYAYDDRGNRVVEHVTNPRDSSLNRIGRWAYEYDPAGNWIRKMPVDLTDGQNAAGASDRETFIVRTISYYDDR